MVIRKVMKLSLLALYSLASALQVVLLTSDRTPFAMSQVRASLSDIPDITISSLSVTSKAPTLLTEPQARVVLDYSYSRDISLRLLAISTESLVICMYVNCPDEEVRGRLLPVEVASNITAYLQAVGFPQLFLAASVSPFYQEVLQYMATQTTLRLTSTVSVKEDLDMEAVEMLVGRVLKPAGSSVAALLVDEETGLHLYPALQKYRIAKKGYAYFLSDEAVWNTKPQGALYVTDSAAVNAQSRLEYEKLILEDQLRQLGRVTAMEVGEMRRVFRVTSRPLTMSLVNLRDGVPFLIGTSPKNLKSSILFPGNTTEVPISREQIIPVSADFTALNFDGTSFPNGYTITRGIQLGYAEVNRHKDLVPNFRFVNYTAFLGGALWNKTFALSQLKALGDDIGIAFHAFGFSATIMNLHALFLQQNMYLSITSIATSPLLSNPVTFPMFLRTSSSGSASALVLLKFFKLWGWKRVAVMYSSGSGDVAFYDVFKNYTRDYGIEMINNETNRIIPLTLSTPEAQAQLNNSIYEILNSTVRIVIIAHSSSSLLVERMYDLGVRAGDYMICVSYGLSYAQFNTPQRREPLHGGMMFYDHYFSGSEGDRIKEMFIQADGNKYEPVGCVYYDSTLLVAHAVDFMLARGLLFEDGRELVRVMRETRFIGCLGVIQIEQGSNDRIPGDFSVLNAVVGPNSSLTLMDAAFYTPSKTQLYTILPNLTFPDGSSESFPDTWPTDTECPYLVKDIRDFPKGRMVGMLTSFLFTALTGLISLIIWWKWWSAPPPRLQKRHHMTMEDGLALLNIPVEFIQFLQMGPKIDFTDMVKNALSSSSLSVEDFLESSQSIFWIVLVLAIGLVMLYLLLCVVKFLDLDGKFENWCICSNIGYWGDLLLPSLSNLLFLPIISTLLSIFNCYRSVGDKYTDSFLNRDCSQMCWEGTHVKFAIAAIISLCLFTPLAVFTRPLWQELQANLHIKAHPLEILVRSVMQMLLISASNTLKFNYAFAHACVFLGIIGGYLLFIVIIKPYNYERLNMWRRLMIMGVVAYGLVGLVRNRMNSLSPALCTLIIFLSFAVLGGVGLLMQRFLAHYRNLLIREKEDKMDIIKFAFTFGKLADTHLRNFKNSKMKSKYSISDISSLSASVAPERRRIPLTDASHKTKK